MAGAQQQQKTQQEALQTQETQALLPSMISSQKAKLSAEIGQSQDAQIADVARRAQAAPDQATAARIWDEGYKQLAGQGVQGVSGYVGHYNEKLADSFEDIFSGRGRTGKEGAGGPDMSVLMPQLNNMPMAGLQTMVRNQNMVITGFNAVHSPEDLRNEVATLRKAGIPVDQYIAGLDLSSDDPAVYGRNFATVQSFVQGIVPYRDAALQSLQARSSGLPGAVGPTTKQQGYVEGYDASGNAIIGNRANIYQPPITQVGVGARPPAGFTAFKDKYEFALQQGLSAEDARNFASGQKMPDEATQRRWAEQAAIARLNAETAAGAVVQYPMTWVNEEAERLYRSWQPPAAGGGRGGAPAAGGGGGAAAGPRPSQDEANKWALGQVATATNKADRDRIIKNASDWLKAHGFKVPAFPAAKF
jgi:hypothetical protein